MPMWSRCAMTLAWRSIAAVARMNSGRLTPAGPVAGAVARARLDKPSGAAAANANPPIIICLRDVKIVKIHNPSVTNSTSYGGKCEYPNDTAMERAISAANC